MKLRFSKTTARSEPLPVAPLSLGDLGAVPNGVAAASGMIW